MKNLEILTTENMKNIEGGNASLPMEMAYKNKNTCLRKAQELINNGTVTGMSKFQIAKEIYAHAIAFYESYYLSQLLGNSKAFTEIMAHAAVVDIENGGDKWYRMSAYDLIWNHYDNL